MQLLMVHFTLFFIRLQEGAGRERAAGGPTTQQHTNSKTLTDTRGGQMSCKLLEILGEKLYEQ